MMFDRICICGGGSLGHVLAGFFAWKGKSVCLLTNRPNRWQKDITIHNCDDKTLTGHLDTVSDIWELARTHRIQGPFIDKVYEWGMRQIGINIG